MAMIGDLEGWTLTRVIPGCAYPEEQPFGVISKHVPSIIPWVEVPFVEEKSRVIDGGRTLEVYSRIVPGYSPLPAPPDNQ